MITATDLTAGTANARSAGGNAATTESGAAGRSLADTFDSFLTLLTVQLRSQDPLSPMDTEAFTQQIVQFTGVEQSIKTNARLEELIDLTRGTRAQEAAAWLGVAIEAEASRIDVPAEGPVPIGVRLDDDVAEATLTVVDAAGRTLYAQSLAARPGDQRIVWNGLDSDGERVPEGDYRVVIDARDRSDKAVSGSVLRRGVVDAVEITDDGLQLGVGGIFVPASSVRRIERGAA